MYENEIFNQMIAKLEKTFCRAIIDRFYFEIARKCSIVGQCMLCVDIVEENDTEISIREVSQYWAVDCPRSKGTLYDPYTIIYSIAGCKKGVLKEYGHDIFTINFAGSFLEFLVHEMRHIYQSYNDLFNMDKETAAPDSMAEKDAVKFAENEIMSNWEYYEAELMKIVTPYQEMRFHVQNNMNENQYIELTMTLLVI